MVLYEATFNITDIIFAVAFSVIAVIIIIGWTIGLRNYENKHVHSKLINSYLYYKEICGAIVGICIFITFVYDSAKAQISPVYNYLTDNYTVIEGYVEDFKEAYDNNVYESFTLNNVEFKYSHNLFINEGYSKIKRKGGVIKENNQHLKIGFYTRNNKNYIVYIEQLN